MRDEASQRRAITAMLAAAIFAAPFLALLVSLEAGLVVMAIGLLATSFLLRDALSDAPAGIQPKLRILLVVNLALAASCLIAVGWRVFGG